MTMTPYQAQTNTPKLMQDKVTGTSKEANSEMAYAAGKGRGREAEEEVAEPVKRESKKTAAPAPTGSRDMDSVLKAWSNEE